MSVLSLDFGVLLGGFCIADITFYQQLLSSTLLLLGAVGLVILRSQLTNRQAAAKETRAKQGVFVAIYLLLFAYPVLSVKIVEAFACHEVGGVHFLRADYRVRCDSQEWKAMAAYASVWICAYVIAFPLFVIYKLWSYRGNATAGQQGSNKPELADLRFLLHDYKSFAPVLMWEGIEMIRKLLLSVVGSFWSTKSTMCIAVALLISAFFLCAHLKYRPFKNDALDRIQTMALTMLTLLYFIGVMLKTETVEESDREDLGVLMVLLLVSVIMSAVGTAVLEMCTARRWLGKVSHAFKILYEGTVQEERGVPCIASFPGKFEDEWSEVVALGSEEEGGTVSVACVYLPLHTPRFGQHVNDPATGRCYCETIYGKRQAW
jgi:hypothetical protein